LDIRLQVERNCSIQPLRCDGTDHRGAVKRLRLAGEVGHPRRLGRTPRFVGQNVQSLVRGEDVSTHLPRGNLHGEEDESESYSSCPNPI